jgi:hypothetical protein
MLHAYDSEHRAALDAATGNPFLGHITEMALFAQAPPIYGGTDQVQRNIIGAIRHGILQPQDRPGIGGNSRSSRRHHSRLGQQIKRGVASRQR